MPCLKIKSCQNTFVMGLDQYAESRDSNGDSNEIACWRKHSALEGWMEKLYRLKGGEGRFNGKAVELTYEDIDLLESVVKDDALPVTVGFFFGGDSSEDAYKKKATLNFINSARKEMLRGKEVFYSSSW